MESSRSEALPQVNEPPREVNALVAAFDNPNVTAVDRSASWQVALSLPPLLTTNAAHPSRIRIDASQVPVGASYEAVGTYVDETFKGPEPHKYQLVLYLDVSPNKQGFWLQRRARKSGYEQKDFTGSVPSQKAKDSIDAAPEVLESTAWINDVLPRWRAESPVEDVHISDDGGLFLSEYAFYRSFASLYLTNNEALAWHERTMVSGLQVPPLLGPDDIATARQVVIALIYALIDSRRQRNGDYDGYAPTTSGLRN